jgi:hypothetical protein
MYLKYYRDQGLRHPDHRPNNSHILLYEYMFERFDTYFNFLLAHADHGICAYVWSEIARFENRSLPDGLVVFTMA